MKLKKLLTAMLFIAVSSQVFANVSGFEDGISEISAPISKILKTIKLLAIIFVVGWIFISAIKYIKSDGGMRAEVLKTGIIGTVVASMLILIAFKVPGWLGLKGADIDAEGAVTTITDFIKRIGEM